MQKVPRLRKGDSVGIVCPAGPVMEDRLDRGAAVLRALGLRVVFGEYAREARGYLAGSDGQRAEDINKMFGNPSIKAIFCARGGFGSMRILKYLDYRSIERNPKIFVGYSDITALHLALERTVGFVTFHGPMVAEMYEGFPFYNQRYLEGALFKAGPIGEIENPAGEKPPVAIMHGTAHGPLRGGNLTLISSTLGTPYGIDTRGCILFLEDIGEPVYRIHRMLTHLQMAGKLRDAAGLIFGQWRGRNDETMPAVAPYLDELLADIAAEEGKPCISNVMIGHNKFNITIPLGCRGLIEDGRFYITEGGVL